MRGRVTTLVVLLAAAFLGLAARLYFLQVVRHDHYVELAEKQQLLAFELNPPRGTVFDRRGRALAVSIPVESVFATPRGVKDPRSVAESLAPVLGLDASKLAEKLDGDGLFATVKRQIDAPTAERVRQLELPGIYLKEESRRSYPQGEVAAHVIGFVGRDFAGLAGIEQRYDDLLTGTSGRRILLRDAGGQSATAPDLTGRQAEPGSDLYLTLDVTLQYLAERELARGVEETGAQSGSLVLLDPATGAVRAMASYPGFDPNRFNGYPKEERAGRWRNRAVADAFEPGSAFKLVPAAAALEANLVDPSDVIDCGMGQIVLHGVRIRDHKPFGYLTFRQVIAKSSNVGTIKTALKLGPDRLYRQIVAFGFGRKTGVDLPGEHLGILHPRDAWSALSHAYVSFGQGISVTALQLTAAYLAVANGGTLLEPYVAAEIGDGDGRRRLRPERTVVGHPMSRSTARQLERLFEAVVTEGTATKAAIDGYRVAGKTSTAQAAVAGGYSATEHFAIFSGFLPAREPLLVGTVVLDRPRTDWHGGQVAAPIFKRVAEQAMVYLGARPDRPEPPRWPLRHRLAERSSTSPPVRAGAAIGG